MSTNAASFREVCVEHCPASPTCKLDWFPPVCFCLAVAAPASGEAATIAAGEEHAARRRRASS